MDGKNPKKRNERGGSNDDSEPQKTGQRGRPRLHGSDENQRERRRAQIRIAQRSYRERKESTISSLNRQVSDLQNTVADMKTAFAELEDKIKEGDSQQDLMKELERTSSRMTALATRSKVDTSTEEEPESGSPPIQDILNARQAPHPPSPSRQQGESTVMGQPLGYETGDPAQGASNDSATDTALMQRISSTDWSTQTSMQYDSGGQAGGSTQSHSQGPQSQYQYLPAADSMNAPGPTMQHSSHSDQPQYPAHTTQRWMYERRSHFGHESQQRHALDPGVGAVLDHLVASRPVELPLHSGQNYKEASFTRRLMRSSLEASINMLKDPQSNPMDVDHFCRYAYCFMKRHNLLHILSSVWARPAGQNLELWRVPYFHVGNAGLHYPRDGIDAGSKPPNNWAESGLLGPLPNWGPHYQDAHQMSRYQQLAYSNVTGDWFDSNDVEAYLRSKGLYLDASTRVVELDEPAETTVPTLLHSASVSTQDSSTGPASPEPLMPIPEPVFSRAAIAQANAWWQQDTQHVLDPSIMNPLLDFGNNDYGTEQQDFGIPLVQSRSKKVVDVEAFLEGE